MSEVGRCAQMIAVSGGQGRAKWGKVSGAQRPVSSKVGNGGKW